MAPGASGFYRHDVEAHGAVLRSMADHIEFGGSPQMALLVRVDGLGGRSAMVRPPRLHLNEDQRVAVERDKIYLGAGGAKIPLQDTIATPPEMALSDSLAAPPKGHPVNPGERENSKIP